MTGPSNSTISISDHEGYRNGVQTLRGLAADAEKLKTDGNTLTEALTAAAGTRVSDAGSTGSGGKKIAPAAAQTLAAAAKAAAAATEAAGAAATSLASSATDLSRLQADITGADDRGTAGVRGA